jgi:glycerate kinase
VPHLVAAPDKFRGTATAADVAAAAASGARAAGWSAEELPLADGGEGTLDVMFRAFGGERRATRVRGPLGEPVDASWLLLPGGLPKLPGGLPKLPGGLPKLPGEVGTWERRPVAVIESAQAAGRALLPVPSGGDPVLAHSAGVGDLVLAAVEAGAELVVVGVGGTATTDGGWGTVSAVGSQARLGRATLVVACDVATPFRAAAETFAPQKGATAAQVATLRARLDELSDLYREELGVDVDSVPGSGAGGGLAGGLAALGARLVPGFALVSALVDLDLRVAPADLLMTGEGRLDAASFEGKVVGGVLAAAGGIVRALCVAGEVAENVWRLHEVEHLLSARPAPVEAVSLAAAFGRSRAIGAPLECVSDVVATACRRWPAWTRL